MGTKVQIENYLPGDYSMRDLSRENNGVGWPSCYGDINLPNGQFYYGFSPKTIADLHPGSDKDVVKQTMLEHEVVFKDQVYELHRLYRVQRDLMDEVRRKEQLKRRIPYETSSSSSPLPSQKQLDDAQRCNGSNFALASSGSGRPLISGPDTVQSSPNLKGKNVQAGPISYQNCYSPKNSEVSESRPTKFRKGMLDLQLPVDEYIDTDEVEQFGGSSSVKNRKPENGKMFLSSDLHFSKPNCLADLNEPLHEETTAHSSVDFLGQSISHGDVSYKDHSKRVLSSSKDITQNSIKSSMIGMNNIQDIRANGQDWFGYASESEHYKTSMRSINQGFHPEKVPAQPVQILLDQPCQPPTFLTSDHIKGEPWKVKSDYHFPLSSYIIGQPSQPGLFHPSQLGKSLDQSVMSWVKPEILTQKPTSIQSSPFLSGINMCKSPHSSAQSNDFIGNKWNLNSAPGAHTAFISDPPIRNGFNQGSSSAFNELAARFPPAGFDHVNCIAVNPRKEMNLNVALSNGVRVSGEHIKPVGLEIIEEDHKARDPLDVLPWLRGKGVCNNKVDTQVEKPESSSKILGVRIFDNHPMSKPANIAVSYPPDTHHQSGREEIEFSKRKLSFDINVPCESIDLVDEVVVVNKKENKSGSVNHFDLNSCIMEEETPFETSRLDNSASVKIFSGIDLEAPASFENEDIILPVEDPLINGDADLAKSAASAIVAISSCVDNSTQVSMEVTLCPPVDASEGDDPLNWFVSIACSSGNDPDTLLVQNDGLPNGLDDFEYTILKLKECNLEEYFPKPSIPDFSIVENDTCALTTRTRRGPGRRGRQKRDFQRDILPGLTTLSRHEVTEDLQTFGGLMRATGYSWHSGSNRVRNGCGRGRRRSVVATPVISDTVCALPLKVQQEAHGNNVVVGVEDRSLTGWGKTTRRPRRQRFPAGNPVLPVPLT